MKTFQEFQKDLNEVAPALLAAPLVLPALTFAAGAGANYLKGVYQARKQGEGGRSQPVDYGQGGTATPRTPNVQRGRLSSNDAYNRRMKELKRQEREQDREAARSKPASQSSSSSELGQKADEVLQGIRDAEYAKQRRENPELLKKEARTRQERIKAERKRQQQVSMRERMRKAAERNNIPEAYSKAEQQTHVKPKPVEIQTITRSAKDDGKEFSYREVLPKKGIYHNTPVVPTQLPKKKDKPVWKNKEFQYPGMPIKDLLRGGKVL